MAYKPKTKITEIAVGDFIAGVENPVRRQDAQTLVDMMREVSGHEPRMWGPTIVGFGSYHYRYESGTEGDMCEIGFSPRKPSQVLYLGPFEGRAELLERLGKYKSGNGGCIYVNKLSDVDGNVLREMVERAWLAKRKAGC
jgi:hypothetical protein